MPAYVTAQLLHPTKRLQHLKSKGWPLRWIKEAELRRKSLWSEYKQRYVDNEALATSSNNKITEPTPYELWQRRIASVSSQKDDFEAFIHAPPTKLATQSTALSWWCSSQQQQAYPVLSKLAIDVLSAMGLSTDSEVVFSCCRRTLD